ncbi:MAG TPA: 2-C-methyl-D-erythritol 2,4-cyclodiphosphate synthase, partial [Verrucomicrobiae bacterium]|nr:2-C-methyl-D-erythritol 2,4-cyclodiphosphate synthase [Verrucomicrobiae bacterium]
VMLCGVAVPHDHALEGHSDADVALHALTDAILGALCEGDIGTHFPDSDQQWKDANSLELLARVVWLAKERGFEVVNADATVMIERPKLRDYLASMRERLAKTMNTDVSAVSVKAKTAEGLDAVGKGEAVMAQAVVLLQRTASQ